MTSANLQAIKLADPEEWLGINTPEQLEEANQRKIAVINGKKYCSFSN